MIKKNRYICIWNDRWKYDMQDLQMEKKYLSLNQNIEMHWKIK